MHGGGSPDGAKLVIRASADLERKVEIARRLAVSKSRFQSQTSSEFLQCFD